MNTWCRCRTCGRKYDEDKATADWKGYCSQACVHEKARALGYKKPPRPTIRYSRRAVPGLRHERLQRTEYAVLSDAKQIGSVPWSVSIVGVNALLEDTNGKA